jgi:Domain of unknown function (DUF3859)
LGHTLKSGIAQTIEDNRSTLASSKVLGCERRTPSTIRPNDWDFYLGDTIWEPISDKLGPWRMSLKMNGIKVAEKTFELFAESIR